MDHISFDSLRELMISARTVRKFHEDMPVSTETLEKLVELTRYCPSGRNAQPLKYRIVTEAAERDKVFPLLKWAGYYQDWDGPAPGERPAAYLIQCLDTTYGANCLCDDGLQLEAINLGMRTLGLGCCIIKAFNRPAIEAALGLDPKLETRYVMAIGFPAEKVVLEDMSGDPEADFKYFRTPDATHHVPKRPLAELIISPSL